MSDFSGQAGAATDERVRHPHGLYLLFVTEMWERFSLYGMLAFLMLYMTLETSVGALGWTTERAGVVFGWYTGLVYLTPIIGGYLADRFLGTHWSMVIGGLIIASGHFTLAGMDLAPHGSVAHIATFFAGLMLIIVGTGFFKPCVSVMVGQLYHEHDARRDAAFTIFYMGINLGAFLGPLICGALRYAKQTPDGVFGWPWAFGAAGVGMVLGLIVYGFGRPFLLRGIGLPPAVRGNLKPVLVGVLVLAGLIAVGSALYAYDEFASLLQAYQWLMSKPNLVYAASGTLAAVVIAAIVWFVLAQKPEDRGPVATIFIMSFFVIFFWTAFGQAGGSMNLFAEHRTDRTIAPNVAEAIYQFANDPGYGVHWALLSLIGVVLLGAWALLDLPHDALTHRVRWLGPLLRIFGMAGGITVLLLGVLKGARFLGELVPRTLVESAAGEQPVYPTEWFQSVNPLFILVLAPVFASIWVRLGRRGREPSTPVKFSLGLILLGTGFVWMVLGARASQGPEGSIVKVSAFWLLAAYCTNTMGELCLSPVGLSMITKLAPVRLVSLLMGVWFLANFAANLLAGFLTGYSEYIAEKGFILEGLPGFFLLFVVAPIGAGLVLLALAPVLKRMMHGRG